MLRECENVEVVHRNHLLLHVYPNFAKVGTLLHALTNKDIKFLWDLSCQDAFDELKTLLTKPQYWSFQTFRCHSSWKQLHREEVWEQY